MPFAKEAFDSIGKTLVIDGRKITREHVRRANLMAIRSTTKVNEGLLCDSPVKFVGTAKIGIDHMDIPYLEKNGIKWCFSPGCNANSVAEYIVCALLSLAVRNNLQLRGLTIGVIGVGNVGRLVAKKTKALGLNVLINDPPREAKEDKNQTNWTGLDDLLKKSDIVTFHVPLEKNGKWPTYQMADQAFLAKMKSGAIFINCARGGIMNTDAVLDALKQKHISHMVIDTWENEPAIRTDMLVAADITTPHIAGHSFEGKVNGTVMVYREACAFLGINPEWSAEQLMPPPVVATIELDVKGLGYEEALWRICGKVYDIGADTARLKAVEGNMPESFDNLRRKYPMRREFRFTEVRLTNASPALASTIKALEFVTVPA
jgi:erythronate-4-phosphate dehydrogenase